MESQRLEKAVTHCFAAKGPEAGRRSQPLGAPWMPSVPVTFLARDF